MTDPIYVELQTDNGRRTVTVTPKNINLGNNILYSTGEYALHEGPIGLGTITFTDARNWAYDGFGDVSKNNIAIIADRIREVDFKGQSKKPVEDAAPKKSNVLNFMVQNEGKAVDARVLLNYPVYDVSLAGRPVAQLQQDHHSNWYVASGKLDDTLVQQIGQRINRAVMEG